MAISKKFLDQIGVGHLWSKIQDELNKKASWNSLISLKNHVNELENAEITLYGGSASDVIREEEH